MVSHIDYIAGQDEEQLAHLISVAKERLDNLQQGGWVELWVVAAGCNLGWFSLDQYGEALDFLQAYGKKQIHEGRYKPELSLERQRYRPAQAQEVVEETRRLIEREQARAVKG